MKVKEIMTLDVLGVKKDTTIEEVAKIMVDSRISSVPVLDDENRVIGMVSQKDMIYKKVNPSMPAAIEFLGAIIFVEGVDEYEEELKKLTATKVDQIMNEKVITVSEEDNIDETARILSREGISSVPVTREDKLVGIVSSTDIIKTLIK